MHRPAKKDPKNIFDNHYQEIIILKQVKEYNQRSYLSTISPLLSLSIMVRRVSRKQS